MKYNAFICMVVCLFFIKTAKAQNTSNEGLDFWAVFPTHIPSGNALANMTVFISAKNNSSGRVMVGGNTYLFSVAANSIASVSIPRTAAYINDTDAGKIITNRGIHIVVDDGKPKVAVYVHVYARARSEAYLVLPVEALGKKYYAMSATGINAPSNTSTPGSSFLAVVATEDNTVVKITKRNGVPFTQSIKLPTAGDVYEILSDDLSGTSIELDETTSSCKTFAAYSGHSGIAFAGNSYDPLAQQLYPIKSWGRVYGVVPFFGRKHFARIIASEDNTTVKINGTVFTKLNQGEIAETGYEIDFQFIEADNPISVAQFTLSQDGISADGTPRLGDPEMVMLNPVEYSIKNITVFSSNLENIQQKYVNVFMRTNYTKSFKINGSLPKSTWKVYAGNATYSYLQEEVTDQSLTLTADDNFNAMAYGFGDHESYAYSAGTNLATNQFLLFVNKVSSEETVAACLGQPSDFKLTLPYLLTQITWKLENGDVLYDDPKPSPNITVVNGQTLYSYIAPVDMIFTNLGQFKFSATGTVAATADNCLSGELNLNFVIDVDPLPTAKITGPAVGCVGQEISFTDESVTHVTGKIVKKWFWDFGDGTTSNEQNPKHIYKAAGKLTVKLYVGGENGCYSDVVAQDIILNPTGTASFTSNENTCINTDVVFKDQSTIGDDGKIVKWIWDMGDGKPKVIKDSPTPFKYQYSTVGKYTITLITESDKQCPSLPFSKSIMATTLPVSEFDLPSFCLADVKAIFTNKSTDVDGGTAELTYLWDFGDPKTGVLNTSTEKDGAHTFNAVGNYTITLTVFNKNSCEKIESKTFTVNGSNPKASFDILGEEFCSNTAFEAQNKASVDFGTITKIEWYLDGKLYTTDNDPKLDKIYSFSYPPFTSPSIISAKLKMIAYSGVSCQSENEKSVPLKASPVVEFNTLNAVCLNEKIFKFQVSELANLSGKGTFSGAGVDQDGFFNPFAAGVGVHEITYSFMADNGCSDVKTQNIEVLPLPQVDSESDIYILAGGEQQFKIKASGTDLTYKWSPSAGLDHDDVLNPIARPEVDVKYMLTVTSDLGCAVIAEINVHVLQNVSAPNTFTPNGDGINDVWNIKYLDTYPNVTVEIFNRNGNRVYFSKGYATPFDGKFNNEPLPVGTYYYIISPNSNRKRITGNLTIIR